MTTNQRDTVLVVTGMSGAGRSTAAKALEDMGWYVVDNLPPQMISGLVDLVSRVDGDAPKVAVVADVRGRGMFTTLKDTLRNLHGPEGIRILYLDANDDALVRRYESVRRPHPLQGDGTIVDGLQAERSELEPVRSSADVIVDTSDLNVHQLSDEIRRLFDKDGSSALRLTVMSFGFKYGTPKDADYVADVRFLPNPFWVPELKALRGTDEPVAEYVLTQPRAQDFIDRYVSALEIVIDGYLADHRPYATIAIGCTGGKHRSVAVAEAIHRRLAELTNASATLRHRDLGKE
ncbi:RNase adapter RapZ [Brevibacterium sp. HMSC24B04]|uniref:RNase adapter RapZ n=1 Tax=Brevibacterium sp. HMSC24B04 TaxID=1581060 RepID=UPI0008A658F0|nr:RNase adapter RapZ [Brevibacterium sp. HMSC24B04]OFT95111.1 RNase adaptor protein RapZ [Brevibacterium sp. HMSC24B04]